MTKESVLLLGSTSFTGSTILHRLDGRYDFTTAGRCAETSDVVFDVYQDDMNILSPYFEKADIVINCFSNGDVDNCEVNAGPSRVLNLEFPKALCKSQKQQGFHLIHFSTNAVYDGENPLYSENSEHLPVNTYGILKSDADKYLLANIDASTLLRPITMYGKLLGQQRHNPFSFFFDKLCRNQDIVAVNDVYVNMLHVDVLVDCVRKVIDERIFGEFNISGDDIVNRFEFVSEIKRHLSHCTSEITETDSTGFVSAARRPLNTSFDNSKMKSVLGIHPNAMGRTIQQLTGDALIQRRKQGSLGKAA